jgi:hypothetical protein
VGSEKFVVLLFAVPHLSQRLRVQNEVGHGPARGLDVCEAWYSEYSSTYSSTRVPVLTSCSTYDVTLRSLEKSSLYGTIVCTCFKHFLFEFIINTIFY